MERRFTYFLNISPMDKRKWKTILRGDQSKARSSARMRMTGGARVAFIPYHFVQQFSRSKITMEKLKPQQQLYIIIFLDSQEALKAVSHPKTILG